MSIFKKAIPRDIHIQPSANGGLIVTVGCCTCTYQSITELMQDLHHYLKNPEKFEAEYNNTSGFLRPQIIDQGTQAHRPGAIYTNSRSDQQPDPA